VLMQTCVGSDFFISLTESC